MGCGGSNLRPVAHDPSGADASGGRGRTRAIWRANTAGSVVGRSHTRRLADVRRVARPASGDLVRDDRHQRGERRPGAATASTRFGTKRVRERVEERRRLGARAGRHDHDLLRRVELEVEGQQHLGRAERCPRAERRPNAARRALGAQAVGVVRRELVQAQQVQRLDGVARRLRAVVRRLLAREQRLVVVGRSGRSRRPPRPRSARRGPGRARSPRASQRGSPVASKRSSSARDRGRRSRRGTPRAEPRPSVAAPREPPVAPHARRARSRPRAPRSRVARRRRARGPPRA